MLWRVLGPLEVQAGRGWTGVAAPKWRALLAALVTSPGRVVSTEGLVDELWGDHPPSAARKLVSGYVLRLRRLIGDPGGRILVTQAPGYLLAVNTADVDACRFEDLLTEGRRMLRDGTAAAAAEVLVEALALWRGPPLADVPRGPLAAAEADRLEELRLSAVELRIEADVTCGNAAGVVAELSHLTAASPLRERFWYLLMRALAQCGRPAEALVAYARAQEVIAGELGADPGPELQQLHRRILSSQASTAASAGGGEPPVLVYSTVIPRQLPGAVRHFTGRASELRQLAGFLANGSGAGQTVVISAIGGTAGVGKTALAVQFAHQVAHKFPDGQLYVNMRGFGPAGGPVLAEEAIRGFLDALGMPAERIPAGLDAQAALYRSLLVGRRIIVVLDNARNEQHVRPLLPGSPGCLAVITSRRQLTGLAATEEACLLNLDTLSDAESLQLLTARLGPDRISS